MTTTTEESTHVQHPRDLGGFYELIEQIKRALQLCVQRLQEVRADHERLLEQLDELRTLSEKQQVMIDGLEDVVDRLEARIEDLDGASSEPDRPNQPGSTGLTISLWDRPHPNSELAAMVAARQGVHWSLRPDCVDWSTGKADRWPYWEIKTGEQAARDCIKMVMERRMDPATARITMQNFGRGKYGIDLHRYPADGIRTSALSEELRHFSPWMEAGPRLWRGWMKEFIATWDEAFPGRPPAAIHQDVEPGFYGAKNGWTTSQGNRWMQAFPHVMEDPRWDTARLAGSDLTLAESYEAAGSPMCNPGASRGLWDPQNADWSLWYIKTLWSQFVHAMNVACYEPVREAWPNCIVGNYAERADVGPVLGDYSSPVLYQSTETVRSRLQSVREADPAGRIIPWVKLPRTDSDAGQSYAPATIKANIEACAEFGCDEIIIWWAHPSPAIHDNQANFDILARIIRTVREKHSG